MSLIPDLFTYVSPKVPDTAIAVLSPSQLAKFFEFPKTWYEETILHKEPEFKGNTSTVAGTICHYIYESVTNGVKLDANNINDTLINQYSGNKDIDVGLVMEQYKPTAEAVVNQYVLGANKHASHIECEQQISLDLGNNIYLAGTYDRLEDDILCDYKTVGTKPNEFVIPFHYKIQLLSYAYALRKMGKEVNAIRIIYGVKPTKTLKARCFVVTETIDSTNEKLIEDTLQLICESILLVKEKPELTHIVFKSMDLKEK